VNGADLNAKDNDGETALHEASKWDHQDIVKFLIDKDADVNAKASDGRKPIEIAIASGNTAIAELLKAHGGSW
jgi:ankyrin repeat protein